MCVCVCACVSYVTCVIDSVDTRISTHLAPKSQSRVISTLINRPTIDYITAETKAAVCEVIRPRGVRGTVLGYV